MSEKPHRRLTLTLPDPRSNGSQAAEGETPPEATAGSAVVPGDVLDPGTPAAREGLPTAPAGPAEAAATTAAAPGAAACPTGPAAPGVAASPTGPAAPGAAASLTGPAAPAFLVVPLDGPAQPSQEALAAVTRGAQLLDAVGRAAPRPAPEPVSAAPPPARGSGLLLGAAVLCATATLVLAVVVAVQFLPRALAKSPAGSAVPAAVVELPAPAPPVQEPPALPAVSRVRPGADGVLVLTPATATTHGEHINKSDQDIGYWNEADSHVTWEAQTTRAGRYAVELTYACGKENGGPFTVSLGSKALSGTSYSTGDWGIYCTRRVGVVSLPPAQFTVAVKPAGKIESGLMSLKAVKLVPLQP
jgi:hypothetical protein